MSKVRKMPGIAWLVIGVCVTALVLPSAAYAVAKLKFTGIEGTSTNRADVTPAGQLLTTEAQPSNLLGGTFGDDGAVNDPSTGEESTIFQTPSANAVIEALTVDVSYWDTSAGSDTLYELYIGDGACARQPVTSWYLCLNPTGYGSTEIPLTPGVGIPSGDALCAYAQASTGSFQLSVTATGSVVPSTSVPAAPVGS